MKPFVSTTENGEMSRILDSMAKKAPPSPPISSVRVVSHFSSSPGKKASHSPEESALLAALQGRTDEAVSMYKKVLDEMNPREAGAAWNNLGLLGVSPAECFRKAVLCDPLECCGWINFGVAGGGIDYPAEECYTTAIRRMTRHDDDAMWGVAWHNLGCLGGGTIDATPYTAAQCFEEARRRGVEAYGEEMKAPFSKRIVKPLVLQGLRYVGGSSSSEAAVLWYPWSRGYHIQNPVTFTGIVARLIHTRLVSRFTKRVVGRLLERGISADPALVEKEVQKAAAKSKEGCEEDALFNDLVSDLELKLRLKAPHKEEVDVTVVDSCEDIPLCAKTSLSSLQKLSNLSAKVILMKCMTKMMPVRKQASGELNRRRKSLWGIAKNEAGIDTMAGLTALLSGLEMERECIEGKVDTHERQLREQTKALTDLEREQKAIEAYSGQAVQIAIQELIGGEIPPCLSLCAEESATKLKEDIRLKKIDLNMAQHERDAALNERRETMENCHPGFEDSPISLPALQEVVKAAMALYRECVSTPRITDDALSLVLGHLSGPILLKICSLVQKDWHDIIVRRHRASLTSFEVMGKTLYTVQHGCISSTRPGALEKDYRMDFPIKLSRSDTVLIDMSDGSLRDLKLVAKRGKTTYPLRHPDTIAIPVGKDDDVIVIEDEGKCRLHPILCDPPVHCGTIELSGNSSSPCSSSVVLSMTDKRSLVGIDRDRRRKDMNLLRSSLESLTDCYHRRAIDLFSNGKSMLITGESLTGDRSTLFLKDGRRPLCIKALRGATVKGFSDMGIVSHSPSVGLQWMPTISQPVPTALWPTPVSLNPQGSATGETCRLLSMSHNHGVFVLGGKLWGFCVGDRLKNLDHTGIPHWDENTPWFFKMGEIEIPSEAGEIRATACYSRKETWAAPSSGGKIESHGITVVIGDGKSLPSSTIADSVTKTGYFLGWHPTLGDVEPSSKLTPLPASFRPEYGGSWRGVVITSTVITLWGDEGILVSASSLTSLRPWRGRWYYSRERMMPHIDPSHIVRIEMLPSRGKTRPEAMMRIATRNPNGSLDLHEVEENYIIRPILLSAEQRGCCL